MKKLLGLVFVVLFVGCAGNGNREKEREDSARIADSIALVEAEKAEQARVDSLRQDSIAKAEQAKLAAQYDALVAQFVASVNNMERAGKRGDFSNMHSLANKYNSLSNKINKVENELSPEQLTKVKAARKKYKRLLNGVIAG